MESRTTFSILAVIALFAALLPAGFAAAPAAPAAVAADANALSFPYQALITADNVNVRCGPGTNYYRCGQLSKGDVVTIVARKLLWSRIIPTKKSFSWISKQYIKINETNPDIGEVTGDNVRVWAGSDEVRAIDSAIPQTSLMTGDKVRLLGEESDDYYKIAPPDNAYLYILTEYTIPAPNAAIPLVGPQPDANQVQPTQPAQPAQPAADANAAALQPEAVAPAKPSAEAIKLDQYHELEQKVKAEREKPIAEQDYSEYQKALTELAADAEAGKAARYAEYTLGQIKRYELAKTVLGEVGAQDDQLKQIEARIEKARAEKLAKIEDLGRFAAVGVLKTSALFDTPIHLRRYRLIGDDGTIICYAAPIGPAAQMSLDNYLDQKVGLTGTIEPYPQIKSALVKFSQITRLK